jgi:hypothetical protein
MTNSQGLVRSGAAASEPAHSSVRFSSTLVGWLIQTAFLAVVQGTCETLYDSRGSKEGSRPVPSSRLVFPLNFYQHALISKAWRRESKLSKVGHVAGLRRRRRAVRGYF